MERRPVSAMYIMTVGVTFLLIPDSILSWFKNQDNAALETVSMTVPYLLMCCALHDLR